VAAPEQPGEIVARRGPAVAARALEVRQDPLAGGGVAVLAGVRELLLFLVTRALFREAGAFAQEQQVTFGVRALVLVPGEAQAELGRRAGILGPAELEQDPGERDAVVRAARLERDRALDVRQRRLALVLLRERLSQERVRGGVTRVELDRPLEPAAHQREGRGVRLRGPQQLRRAVVAVRAGGPELDGLVVGLLGARPVGVAIGEQALRVEAGRQPRVGLPRGPDRALRLHRAVHRHVHHRLEAGDLCPGEGARGRPLGGDPGLGAERRIAQDRADGVAGQLALDRAVVAQSLAQGLVGRRAGQPLALEVGEARRVGTAVAEEQVMHEDVALGIELATLAVVAQQGRVGAGVEHRCRGSRAWLLNCRSSQGTGRPIRISLS